MPMNLDEGTEQLGNILIGAAIEVHQVLGPGLLESIYENALAEELRLRGIDCQTQAPLPVRYKGKLVGDMRVDLLVSGGPIIVENKAVESIHPIHEAQLITYLKAGRVRLGYLINWNVPLIKQGIKRFVV
ncbi:MAG: GxxExxY protein [Planctomycetota bacterium]